MRTVVLTSFRALILVCLVMTGGFRGPVLAQGTVAPPAPVQSAPLAPPPGLAPPALTPPPVPPPVASPPSAEVAPGQPGGSAIAPAPALPPPPPGLDRDATLAGRPGDPVNVDELMLAGKLVAIVGGQATWDQGFAHLQGVFARMRAEIAREGLGLAGRPLTLFIETDDIGFRYEAMLPIDRVPEGKTTIGDGIRFGLTPSGPAMRFNHKAAYDDIDSTYETITAYLEAKGVVVKDAFLEEYVSDMVDPADPNLEINVYVQPR
jgi:effector-binding domain-containing protein